MFYNLHSKKDILEMVAFNMGVRDWRLSDLDGWGDLPDSLAFCRLINWELEEFEEE